MNGHCSPRLLFVIFSENHEIIDISDISKYQYSLIYQWRFQRYFRYLNHWYISETEHNNLAGHWNGYLIFDYYLKLDDSILIFSHFLTINKILIKNRTRVHRTIVGKIDFIWAMKKKSRVSTGKQKTKQLSYTHQSGP